MTDVNSPEFRDITTRINRAKQHMVGWKENIKRWRRLYDLDHYNQKAKQREIQYNDPTFTNTVDLAVGIMLANRLNWHAFGFSPSLEEQEETSQIEKLLDGTLMVNDEREEMHQLYQLYLHFVRDGGAALYSIFDPQIANESKMTREVVDAEMGSRAVWAFKEIPVRVQVVDPASMIGLPGGPRRWLMLGRVEQRSVLDIEAIYEVNLPQFSAYSDEQKSSTMGEFIDVWDYARGEGGELQIRNTVIFEGIPLVGPRIMPGYKELPYTLQFFKPTDSDPEHWHSILKPLEGSVSLLERTFNRRAHQIDVFTSLPLISKTQMGRAVKIDPGLYNHVNITPDESIEFPAWNGNPPDINFHIEFLRSRIQQSGFSDVMFGAGASQVAGYALSQLGDQNRIRMEQPIKHLELLLSHWAKKTLQLLFAFARGSQVCVYGQHKGKDYIEYVDVDDLNEYAVRAEIKPEYPNEKQRKVAMSTQVKGTLSDYTIMERYLDIEQPDEEEERRLLEQITRHPVTIDYMIRKELRERAEGGDKDAGAILQQLEQQAMATGQPGRPADPRNPEQLTGLQSPDGQPVPQANGESPAQDPQEAMANAAPGYTE